MLRNHEELKILREGCHQIRDTKEQTPDGSQHVNIIMVLKKNGKHRYLFNYTILGIR